MRLPQTYGWIPIAKVVGSLATTFEPVYAGLEKNFNFVQASVRQIIAYLSDIDARLLEVRKFLLGRIVAGDAATAAVAARASALEAKDGAVVKITAGAGGTTWALSALTGYPNIRAVVVDPNGEANVLNLPALGGGDRLCLTVKCLSNSGNLEINAGSAQIVSTTAGGSSYTLPFAFLADGLTLTTYAATLAWDGVNWQVLDNAVRIA